MAAGKLIRGNIDINLLIAFVFGVVFLSVMLGFAVWFPNPTAFQFRTFMTALALSAAGIGALIPGKVDFQYKGVVRAGGAMALFAIVWFSEPLIKDNVVQLKRPASSSESAALAFLSQLDRGDASAAYGSLDQNVQDNLSREKFLELYNNTRARYGAPQGRTLTNVSSVTSPPGLPVGLYDGYTYLSKLGPAKECHAEAVLARATQSGQWAVYTYQVSPVVPC